MLNLLTMIEIKSRYYAILNKCKIILFLLALIYPIHTALLLLIILIVIIIECTFSLNEKDTIIFKCKNKIIGFINGSKNYIHKCMVLPEHQGNGIGKKLLNSYLHNFCKNCKDYYFHTSIFLDTLQIYKKYNNCKINTDNYINYKITCPI